MKPFKLAACILICLLAGILGSLFTTTGEGSWYSSISKPEFTPPGWVFGPVWTTLYAIMGISLYLILEAGNSPLKKPAIALFSIQLFLNFLWSMLFFGIGSPFLALIEIIFLWIAIAATIFFSWRVSKNAALLLIPYILWVSFAAFLNYSIFLLNP
jgi:tryptophan-rich sensory protein